jgi:hypothetical protein
MFYLDPRYFGHEQAYGPGIVNREDFKNLQVYCGEQNGSRKEERGYGLNHNPLIYLVGTRGFEPLTPTASR